MVLIIGKNLIKSVSFLYLAIKNTVYHGNHQRKSKKNNWDTDQE